MSVDCNDIYSEVVLYSGKGEEEEGAVRQEDYSVDEEDEEDEEEEPVRSLI